MAFILFVLASFFLHGALGEIICEELPTGLCAFAVSSSQQRCLLENYVTKDGTIEYECKTSEIAVKNFNGWIESDECMNACGIDRKMTGIASDSLLEPRFIVKLCSPSCYDNCPNIVDLYHNLAIGEVHNKMPRRAMTQILSSGAASGPTSDGSGLSFGLRSVAEAPLISTKGADYAAYAPSSI
ncbi:hypothetical protein E3N88_11047 [Mikania micrantha]|uniref:PAR1 protein n=1 Tax=Mikania micrantha TaxID=192012 RepID=A0A5N6PF88_9ASTR|nr:hypothetical protein E3N88_11047 [Mikania micrantha]